MFLIVVLDHSRRKLPTLISILVFEINVLQSMYIYIILLVTAAVTAEDNITFI